MEILDTLIIFLATILNPIGSSSQSDGSSRGSRRPAPGRPSLRSPGHGSPSTGNLGEHFNVSLHHNEPPHEGPRRTQYTTSEHPGIQIQHSDDILLPLALEKWPLLAESLRKDWPAHAEYYYFVLTAIKWKAKEPNLPHTIYCPNGDYNSGIFVAISYVGEYRVIPFANKGFESLLYKTVTETKMIDWARGVTLPICGSRIISAIHASIDTLKHTKGIDVECALSGNVFFIPKEKAAAFEIRVPEGCYLNSIEESHVPWIIQSLSFERPVDLDSVKKTYLMRVKLNGGLGLFSKKTNELLSWNLQGEYGESSGTFTVENARRKGYAKVVKSAFAKMLAEGGFDMFGFVSSANVASEAMWKSVDAEIKGPYAHIQIKKSRSRE